MLRNYFKLAIRNLLKNKLFSAIKLAGLTAAITACLLIGLYLHHELRYEACHDKADRIARIAMEYGSGGIKRAVGLTGNKVAPTFHREFPEVENAVRTIKYEDMAVRYGDKLFEEKRFFYADSTFFEVFTMPLLAGNASAALRLPNQVVLSESMAKKYFGVEDPMGKIIQVGGKDYSVSGVMRDAPKNTQIRPDFIGSFVSLRDAAPERETWWNANYTAFLLLRDPASRPALEQKIARFMETKTEETGVGGDRSLTYFLELLPDLHLRSRVEGTLEPNGDPRYLYILLAVAGLILLIACTTYVNLSTAAALERAREVGVQKVLGAGHWQLVGQYLGEALALTAAALLAGYTLAAPLLPLFNRLFDRSLDWHWLLHPLALLGATAFALLVSLLAGAYPALTVASFQPIEALKSGSGSFTLRRAEGSGWLRQSLIVLQFGIGVFLLACTAVLHQQMTFIQDKKLGYDKDRVIALPTDRKIVEQLSTLKSELLQNSGVQSVSLAYETPTKIDGGYGIAKSISGQDGTPVTALPCDPDFLKTMNIQLAAGHNFDQNDIAAVQRLYKGDTAVIRSILINESQAGAFGWTPEEALLQFVNINGPAQIKGVVRDFHFASLHEPIGNLVIFPDTWGNTILVKLSGPDLAGALSFVEQKWQTLAPHRPFSYHFLDEEFDQLYQAEIRTSRLVSTFAGIAILLACLGLFGVASHTIVRRTKEIGIRKVLGAGTAGIVGLLSKDFLKLVLSSFVIGAPLAWYAMENWLSDFTYRVGLQWWVFGLAGLAALVLAFLTVSVQSIRAATADPVRALRSE